MPSDSKYALIIGVGYDLPETVKDAAALERILVNPSMAGYHPDNVRLLTEASAKRDNVLTALDEIIHKSQSDPEATVLIYYSGHGGQYQNGDKQNYVLKLYGYDDYQKDTTMIRGEEFADKINRIEASKLLVLFDCCHSAGMNNEQSFLRNNGFRASGRNMISKLGGGKGRVFMSSCDDDEKSLILKGAENSLFTEALMEALHGDNSPDRPQVHVIDVLSHLLRKVPEQAAKADGGQRKQNPVISEVQDLDPHFYICANSQYGVAHKESFYGRSLEPIASEEISEKNASVVRNYGNIENVIILDKLVGDINIGGNTNGPSANFQATRTKNGGPNKIQEQQKDGEMITALAAAGFVFDIIRKNKKVQEYTNDKTEQLLKWVDKKVFKVDSKLVKEVKESPAVDEALEHKFKSEFEASVKEKGLQAEMEKEFAEYTQIINTNYGNIGTAISAGSHEGDNNITNVTNNYYNTPSHAEVGSPAGKDQPATLKLSEVSDLIEFDNDLEGAIDALRDLYETHLPRKTRDIIMQASKYNGLMRDIDDGVLTDRDQINQDKARIRRALLNMIKKLERVM